MNNDKPLIVEKEKIKDVINFNENIFKNISLRFSQNFYPVIIENNDLKSLEIENSQKFLSNIEFYRIYECIVENTDDLFEFFINKMQNIFTMFYSLNKEFYYGFVSKENKVNLVIGFETENFSNEMEKIIEGNISGIKLEKFNEDFTSFKNKENYVGYLTGVPDIKLDGKIQNKDISSLIRSLNGENYIIMTLCRPVQKNEIIIKVNEIIDIKDACATISKRTVSLQKSFTDGDSETKSYTEAKGVSNTTTGGISAGIQLLGMPGMPGTPFVGASVSQSRSTNHSTSTGSSLTKSFSETEGQSVSLDIQNGWAMEMIKISETILERMRIGMNIGMWETLTTYSSDNELVAKIIGGRLYSEISSNCSTNLVPQKIDFKKNNEIIFIPKDFNTYGKDKTYGSLVTSEELCAICSIPSENIPNFEIKKSKLYSLTYNEGNNNQSIGKICEYDKILENTEFSLSESDINKHTFVCGMTGMGKTNTVKMILDKINKPFLVIEPAKKEYRNINKEKKVYTLGNVKLNSLRLNPFYILPGINPQQHIDLLKDLFSASFALYGPMPYIVEKCLSTVYEKKGWNLSFGYHPYLIDIKDRRNAFNEDKIIEKYSEMAHKYLFPTMQDLKNEVDEYVESMEYDKELKGNIKSAINARIDSLCVGSKGYIFNSNNIPDFNKLFSENTVLELEGLGDDADKSFSMGLVIIFLNEYMQVKKELENTTGLKHILVIEEAHRLLKNINSEGNENFGNPKGKAVEHFTNMLAEMRSYGEGIIVSEQIPTKLAPDVIKNSSNKIVHRLASKDDQEIMANTIGLKSEEAIYIGNQKTGYALCSKEGLYQPLTIKIKRIEDKKFSDNKLYNDSQEDKFLEIDKIMLNGYFSSEIDIFSKNILLSLMYFYDISKINFNITKIYEKFENLIFSKSISIVSNDINKLIKECIIEKIFAQLTGDIFRYRKLPSNEFLNLLKDKLMQKYLSENDIAILQEKFKEFYKEKSEKKAIRFITYIATNILGKIKNKKLESNNDFEKICKDLLLIDDEIEIEKMRKRIKENE
ncbi:ATP-binding protein [Fusobacterium polymorphum]|jgi:ATPase|uniref:ATP-binding protein n=1 Tax=Fusobacterium nucleatum subsp. polymorphum TaxID=76857 RepID=UPI001C6E02A2|nr:DUF87 domain-containing protein [Fusobacterium polymorphum]QYR62207.1 DUF87 domain-containing protein [Fusobacterium polymorphum]